MGYYALPLLPDRTGTGRDSTLSQDDRPRETDTERPTDDSGTTALPASPSPSENGGTQQNTPSEPESPTPPNLSDIPRDLLIPYSVGFNAAALSEQLLAALDSGHRYTGYRGAEIAAWADREVGIADYLGLMPYRVDDYFSEPVLRGDYAALIYRYLLVLTDLTEIQLQEAVDMISFTDSDDVAVSVCAGLGILGGYSDGSFRPDEPVTRQVAAVILSRTATIVGAMGIGHEMHFTDISGLWGEEAIRHLSTLFDPFTGNHVMGSTGNNAFSPNNTLSRLQAVLTTVRMTGVSVGTFASGLGLSGLHEPPPPEPPPPPVVDNVNGVRVGLYINDNPQTAEPYKPFIDLRGDGTFTYRINFYEGIEDILGTFTVWGDDVICTISPDYNNGIIYVVQNNQTYQVDTIIFRYVDDMLFYNNEFEIGMNVHGDLFKRE